MAKEKLDSTDKELICQLARDGRMPMGRLGDRLGVSAPTVRSRLKALGDAALFRVAGLVDAYRARGITTAIVGIRLDTYQLEEKLDAIAALDQVHWAAVVTGRYDIMAEVISTDGMAGLHRFLSEKLYKVGGIKSSESYVVMKSERKWILLPEGICQRIQTIDLTVDK
jgi:Lrp/AsnC family transcriptional regulator for asnA, asnC and gidA